QPLAEGRRGLAARLKPQSQASSYLLHDPGENRPAGISALHQSEEAPALQLRTFPRKPVARKMGFHRHPSPLHSALEKTRRSLPRRRRRGVGSLTAPFANIASPGSSTVAARNTFC